MDWLKNNIVAIISLLFGSIGMEIWKNYSKKNKEYIIQLKLFNEFIEPIKDINERLFINSQTRLNQETIKVFIEELKQAKVILNRIILFKNRQEFINLQTFIETSIEFLDRISERIEISIEQNNISNDATYMKNYFQQFGNNFYFFEVINNTNCVIDLQRFDEQNLRRNFNNEIDKLKTLINKDLKIRI